MKTSSVKTSAGAFAVTLLPLDPQHPARLAGCLEHVLSGRRHDFDDGPQLLACLALEQRLCAAASSASPSAAS